MCFAIFTHFYEFDLSIRNITTLKLSFSKLLTKFTHFFMITSINIRDILWQLQIYFATSQPDNDIQQWSQTTLFLRSTLDNWNFDAESVNYHVTKQNPEMTKPTFSNNSPLHTCEVRCDICH